MRILVLFIFVFSMLLAEDESYFQHRITQQTIANQNHFSLMPYKKNYLVYSQLFAGANGDPYHFLPVQSQAQFKDYELQLQVSIMTPVWLNMFDQPLSIYAAYTNRSFWQFFDTKNSQPFRETNHEPEIWVSFFDDLNFGDVNSEMIWLGFVHQSNGQYTQLSRGWNRVYMNFFSTTMPSPLISILGLH